MMKEGYNRNAGGRMQMIPFWTTNLGEAEIISVTSAITNRKISQGLLTEQLEERISEILGTQHVIMVTSGSTALVVALMALDIGVGDEVIIPDRTWIATAHAVLQVGAIPKIIDIEPERPVIDIEKIKKAINKKTKAIIPVHMNGRSAEMQKLLDIADQADIEVIEDAAQALLSKHNGKYLGTYGKIGCFSLSMAKLITTGQGGFLTTSCHHLNQKIRRIRTHGLEGVFEPANWEALGGNFRFTDIQAAIGHAQLDKIQEKAMRCKQVSNIYSNELQDLSSVVAPIREENAGDELRIYNEFLFDHRDQLSQYLKHHGIESRAVYPQISSAKYICEESKKYQPFTNSDIYASKAMYLPSGPDIESGSIKKICARIRSFYASL